MTEENTNLEAVGTPPATKRRVRRTGEASNSQKRTARKTRPADNGAAPPDEENALKVEVPPLAVEPTVSAAS